MVGNYFHVLEECKYCRMKFSSLNVCFEKAIAFFCDGCDQLYCGKCLAERVVNNTLFNCCDDCYDGINLVSDDMSAFDSEYDYADYDDN